MILTFIDSGVLIAAARGNSNISDIALQILEDPDREFASSIFLKMEVLPKAIYNQQTSEVRFYDAFFNNVSHWATNLDQIIEQAYRESSQFGLGTMDALHISAAVFVGAVEFITNEKSIKSIHRTKSVRVTSIHVENSDRD